MRSLIFILLLTTSTVIYARTQEEAWSLCTTYISTHPGWTCAAHPNGSSSILALTQFNSVVQLWGYTGDCVDTSQIISTTTHSCSAACPAPNDSIPSGDGCPTAPCVAGTQKTLIVQDADMPANNPPTFYLHNHKVVGTVPTATLGGCVYELPSSGYNNCQVLPGPPPTQVCRVLATQNGNSDQSGDTALDPDAYPPQQPSDCPTGTTFSEGRCLVDKADNDCMRLPTGDEICNAHPKKNCGTYNGTEVCVSPDGTIAPTLDGKSTTSTNANGQTNNCVPSSDGVTCINLPSIPKEQCGGAIVCVKPERSPGQTPPTNTTQVNENLETATSSTTTPNSSGGTTTVTTTTQNVIGSEPTVTTVVKDANGNVVSTTTTGGQGQVPTDSNGHATGSGTKFDGKVSDEQTHTLLDSIKSTLTDLKDSLTGSGTPPTKPNDGLDDIFSNGQDQLSDSLNTTTGYLTNELNIPLTGSCEFPTLSWHGKTTSNEQVCSRLETIKTILGYVLYVLTFVAIVEIATRGTT